MTFSRNGSAVDLSRTEQRLLRLLVENRGRTLPRSLLLDRVWDRGEFVDENALSVAVRRLRAKLGDAPIKTCMAWATAGRRAGERADLGSHGSGRRRAGLWIWQWHQRRAPFGS